MDSLQERKKLSTRQKCYISAGVVAAASAYFGYKLYRSDSLAALQEFRCRLKTALASYSRTLLLASEVSSTIAEDLNHFFSSDTDEIPQSLRQLTKLAKSKEVAEAISRCAAAAVQGALKSSSNIASESEQGGVSGDYVQRVIDSLSSERGMSLVSLAVKIACQTSIHTLYEQGADAISKEKPSWWQQVIEGGSSPQGEKLYTACISTFVREGMKVYMGSLEGVNSWEDFLGSIRKPEHQAAIDRTTRVFVNELVTVFFKRARHGLRGDGGKASKGTLLKQGNLPAAPLHSACAPSDVNEIPEAHSKDEVRILNASRAQRHNTEASHSYPSDSVLAPYSAVAQQFMNPEVRGLLTVVVGTAAFEGVRSCLFTAREMLTGIPGSATALPLHPQSRGHLQQLATRSLGTLLLFVFMPVIIFLAGRRAALP